MSDGQFTSAGTAGELNPAFSHGHNMRGARSPTYVSWAEMKTRVTNPARKVSARYVGRGIDMDPRWRDFRVFLSDMGARPEGMTLERRDNDKGYWPDNCCWATRRDQRRNTSHCVWVLVLGERMLVVDALERLGANWSQYRRARWTSRGKVKLDAQAAIDLLSVGKAPQ